jgi:hypothetical protein
VRGYLWRWKGGKALNPHRALYCAVWVRAFLDLRRAAFRRSDGRALEEALDAAGFLAVAPYPLPDEPPGLDRFRQRLREALQDRKQFRAIVRMALREIEGRGGAK